MSPATPPPSCVPLQSGETPLHWAATFGRLDVAQALLGAGAATGAQDKEGDTPLHKVGGRGPVGGPTTGRGWVAWAVVNNALSRAGVNEIGNWRPI